jgi:hypothetical protein
MIFFSLMPNDQRGWLPLFNQHLHLSRFSFSLQPGWLFLTVWLISFHPETQSDEIIKKSDLFGREIT